jgi:hypothetical protein
MSFYSSISNYKVLHIQWIKSNYVFTVVSGYFIFPYNQPDSPTHLRKSEIPTMARTAKIAKILLLA